MSAFNPSPSLKHRIEAAAAAIFAAFFGLLPIGAASAVGGLIGRMIGPHLPLTRRARRNLELILPELTPRAHRRIIGEMWDNLGRVVAEYPHLIGLSNGPAVDRIEIVGAEHLHAAVDSKRPVILVTGHLANWEIGLVVARVRDIPLALVYRALDNPLVDDMLKTIRRTLGRDELIPKGAAGARQLIAALKRCAVVVMLIDQKLNDGIAAPFFGRRAMSAPAAAEFALRYQAVLLPTRIERLRGARFRLTLYPPVEPERFGDRHREVLALTTRLNSIVEVWIRERPGQWFWLHRRWPES